MSDRLSPLSEDQNMSSEEPLSPPSDRVKFEREEANDIKFQLNRIGLKKGVTALALVEGRDPLVKSMSEMVGSRGRVVTALPLHTRIDEVKRRFRGSRNITFFNTDREQIALDAEAVDFVLCRGVFSHILDSEKFLSEIIRVTKNGGKVVVADIDWPAFCDYPVPEYLMSQMHELLQKIAAVSGWDLSVGRKLFAYFHEAGLLDVRAHVFTHRLVSGEANPLEREEWEQKLAIAATLDRDKKIQLSFDLAAFRQELFGHFQNPDRFAYAPLIVVEGIKPL